MGATASALLSVLGQGGDVLARAKQANREEAQRNAIIEDQLKTTALNRVLSQQDIGLRRRQLEGAEVARRLAEQRFLFDVEQAQGKEPSAVRAKIEGALGRKMTDTEAQHLFKLAPNTTPNNYQLKMDQNRELWWIPKPGLGLKPVRTGIRGPAPASNQVPRGPQTIEEYAESVRRGDMKLPQVPQNIRGDVITYMHKHGETPGRARTTDEIRQLDAIKKVTPVVSRLRALIEKNRLQGVNGYMDIINAQKNWQLYSHGKKPAEPYAMMIKDAAALRIMGAAPWVTIGRGRYLFDEIQKHLPNPAWDTPALLYDKMQFLQGILDDAQAGLTSDVQGAGPGEMLPPP